MSSQSGPEAMQGVAIVGMAGSFPRAKTIVEFWRNLREGIEAISFFDDEELMAAGVEPLTLADAAYVKSKAMLDDIEQFDASFFGITPKEAEMMDPQQRLFMECAWTALEHAGYDSEQYRGSIGLFAGSGLNSYLVLNLLSHAGLVDPASILQSSIPNRTDHLTTRVAYKLNLKGPAVTVQTACSTSLVAVHLACQSLLSYQCDMVLAGGVTVGVPQKSGYYFQEGGVLSPDGHCRAFDHRANGTVVGNGVGVVVLKRLDEALAEGDEIYAVIKGSAINNDGAVKIGYTAPSVEGQSEVIITAQEVAGVSPETISYIEAHGTGTKLGDPMEMATLKRVFGASTQRKQFCAVGSVKTNIGHLDAAAGIAGLIKTTLALKHRELPPSLHFERPNPEIDFADSPFYVNTERTSWDGGEGPRRAGVSSFGIGGTNAHVVLEEAPPPETSGATRTVQLLVLSAKTASALETASANLGAFLRENPQVALADVAYTLKVGRRALNHRRSLVCSNAAEAVESLASLDPRRVVTGLQEPKARPVIFMFPGQGAQYVGMGRELYETEHTFRSLIDYCSERLAPRLGIDLRDVLYPPDENRAAAAEQLKQTRITQPALFVVEYAQARLWMEWGIAPQAMIGHSIGEYVAATLAGVFALDDALALVAARGRLMQSAEPGAMTAVTLPEAELEKLLGAELSLASVNSPSMCVVAGTREAVGEFEARMEARGVACRRLQTSHAFHSRMMEPILESFRSEVERVARNAPRLAYVSNLTGRWIKEAEAVSADYWVEHLRRTVRFGDGIARLFEEPDALLLEVGPGRTLMTIARWHPSKSAGQTILTSLPHPEERTHDLSFMLGSLGRLWLAGVQVDWQNFYARERRRRLALPTYPFERVRYWIEPARRAARIATARGVLIKNQDIADWFYVPSWRSSVPPARSAPGEIKERHPNWILFLDESGVGARLADMLARSGCDVTLLRAGGEFAARGEREFTIRPRSKEDYDEVLKTLAARGRWPTDVAHLWGVTPEGEATGEMEDESTESLGFYSLLALARALGERSETSAVRLAVVTNGMQPVTGDESLCPDKALVTGSVRVVPQEFRHVTGRSIDLKLPSQARELEKLCELLLHELVSEAAETPVAYRHNQRWTQSFEPLRLGRTTTANARLRERGVYLITGGMGGIGLVLAEHLARQARARLVLLGRSAFPARERWQRWLATHEQQDETSRRIRHLQKLASLGARVEVLSADVTDYAEMTRVVARIEEQFGTVNGVIHAAGVPGGGMIQFKTEERAAQVLAPKVKGAKVLEKLFENSALDFMLLCSSRSSILGGFGQIDYCAANAFLDAFAADFARKTGIFTLAVNWDAWAGVGMLVNTAAQYGIGATGERPAHPLLDRCVEETDERKTYATDFSVARHWILEEHRIGGTAVLPGVTYLEMARAAFESHADGQIIELRDVYFVRPMSIRDDEQREVRLVLEKNGDGFKFQASSKSASGEDARWLDHAIGEVRRMPAAPPLKHDLDAIIERGRLKPLPVDEDERDPDLGPRWQNIKKVYAAEGEVLVLFELPAAFSGDLEHLKLHPALLDRAAGTGMLYMELDGIYLPMSYRSLRFRHPLPRTIYAHIKRTASDEVNAETITFDVVIMDDNGMVLVEIDEFSEKRVNDLTGQMKAMADRSGRAAAAFAFDQTAKPEAKSFYEQSIAEGITPSEGSEVFARLLESATTSQVVVSTKDLNASIEQANAFTQEMVSAEVEKLQAPRTRHARPEVRTPYAAPQTPVEATLVEIMQEMLGLDRVGIHDNFFELGGDSVLSIQIIAKASRLGVRITPQQIFQYQTVAELAAVALPGAEMEHDGALLSPAAQSHAPAPAAEAEVSSSHTPFYRRAGVDAGKLSKLSRLIADDEDEDDGEPDAEEFAKPIVDLCGGDAGELESLLSQHPHVREVAVVARNAEGEDAGLIAYVVLKEGPRGMRSERAMEFSLFFFAADNLRPGEDKYNLYLEGARFADQNGFSAVWTPERHFHQSGGPYPNPSVLSAALATITGRVGLRAGSVVMPLHHAARVAEEWAVVDNLSRGRVGVSFTSGWIPNDFAFFPERFARKREEMFRGIEQVQRLWRGEPVEARDGAGNATQLRVLPRPVQPELPVWLTCSGDPEMFVKAGEMGHNVLTALLTQSVEEVAKKVGLYREARARAGHEPESGHVTLMMHTFVVGDPGEVDAKARAPLCDYLRAHVGLIETMTKSLDISVGIDKEKYLDDLVAFAFERYYQTASLIGTPDKCLEMVERLKEAGVDEVACFIDFGIDTESVLDSLRHLNALKALSSHLDSTGGSGVAAPHAETIHSFSEFVREKSPRHVAQTSFVLLDKLPPAVVRPR